MDGLAAPKVIFCPSCRQPHVACSLEEWWRWFTCGAYRFSFPDQQQRLGSALYANMDLTSLIQRTGCPGCGNETSCTDLIEEQVSYICYRCGEVGIFRAQTRANNLLDEAAPVEFPVEERTSLWDKLKSKIR
jgi:hypothetical protein